MTSNRKILEELFVNNKIDLKRGGLFDTQAGPMPQDFDFNRVEGMMLGLAIGDSLGRTTEGWLPRNTLCHPSSGYCPPSSAVCHLAA
ncbi:MAG: ADP-ribosylglycohydrolase family protein [Deltaproteobacteria bacterium]|nr:ADP-ribosylglycohydrolase family protein [Deltaproteobacteria bacterium]